MLLCLWLTVKNVKQSHCQSQQIAEAVETEINQMSSQFHNLQQHVKRVILRHVRQ